MTQPRPVSPLLMAVDVETTGLDFILDKLHGIGISYEEGTGAYYPADAVPIQVRQDLANPAISKIGHNFHTFDAKVLQQNGFVVNGEFDDTMVLASLCGDEVLGLKALTRKYLGDDSLDRKVALDQYCARFSARHVGELCLKDLLDPNRPHTPTIAEYCIEDVQNTISLYNLLLEKIRKIDRYVKKLGFKKSPLDYYQEEARPLERVLFEIESTGIRIDLTAVEEVRKTSQKILDTEEEYLTRILRKRIDKVEEQLVLKEQAKVTTPAAKAKRIQGEGKCRFSWGNAHHLADLLYRYCDLPAELTQRTTRGGYRVDKAALNTIIEQLPIEHRLRGILARFLTYKQQQKILSTYTGDDKKGLLSNIRYIDGIPRIFPSYRQTTGTGRLACKNPNMQNLPRASEIKRFFIPDTDGNVFDDLDYSQIELRTGAHLSQDELLVSAYRNGEDVHLQTASMLFGREITVKDDLERQAGKRTNFLTIFDGKEYRLAASLKADTGRVFSLQECAQFIHIWFERYHGVRSYLDSQKEFFEKYRFCISETGRIRLLPEIESKKLVKESYENGRLQLTFLGDPDQRMELAIAVRRKFQKTPNAFTVCKMAIARYNHAVKAGYNQPIQGLAASMTKRSMILLHRAGVKIKNQVHDSLVIERAADDLATKQKAISVMTNSYPLSVPVVVDSKTLRSFHPKDKA